MRHCHGHVLLIPAALSVTACAVYSPRTPILPERFEGPLSANADSLVASTQALYCAPTRHLDFGTTPQGCVRVAGDMRGWVNWTGTNRVVKVGRSGLSLMASPPCVSAIPWKASSRADWDPLWSAITRITRRGTKSDGLPQILAVFPRSSGSTTRQTAQRQRRSS